MSRLGDRIAIVTGAGRGIGAETAKRLAQDGAKVALFDLNSDFCRETVQAIQSTGKEAIGISCDISDNEQVNEAVEKVASHFGGIDILVNNAGVTRDNLLFKMSVEDWDMVMNVHLKGSFLCAKAVQKFMVQKRYGKIINISSTSALGNRGQANYSTAKAGLQGFTRSLAMELGPFNINVNSVAPGYIVTEMTKATSERMGLEFEEQQRKVAEGNPLRRVGRPEDIANVIAFLASEDASYVNGQIIYVNGGAR
ncbi:beta-ketoacyl-ACP reductase [Neobacillus kokaensis]|uniref:3-oxoacyl-ACP reductase n=1 Tax=Neobacillus kokaensis TaxID=2759023 RepID=A0ABQ3NA80_9BACI|nr:beta-ketoacyl-ACP reductase [Neobacillus kokaensis]GHH99925.1 3-oxoacyl-ACP reductase [Neobacillus kokaensis]